MKYTTPEKNSSWFKKGHRQSEESRKKMSLARIGKPPVNKTNIFISCIECGKERKVTKTQLTKGAKYCSRECTNKHKDMGKTPLAHKIRMSKEYKDWRTSIFERDNYTCTICNLHSGCGKRVELNADHIKPFAYFPELRFDMSNGRTLCRECHRKTDTFGSKVLSNLSKWNLLSVGNE